MRSTAAVVAGWLDVWTGSSAAWRLAPFFVGWLVSWPVGWYVSPLLSWIYSNVFSNTSARPMHTRMKATDSDRSASIKNTQSD